MGSGEKDIHKVDEVRDKIGSSYLSAVTSERQRILTSKSFLRIGQEVGADTLELMVRIPGDEVPKLLKIDWEKNDHVIEPEVIPFESLKGSIIEKVLNTRSEVVWSGGHEYVNGSRGRQLEEKVGAMSVIAVPLIFQDALIGCVCVRSQDQPFNKTAISKVRDFAIIAALVAHWERELAAAERFNSNLIRWRVKTNPMPNSEELQGIADRLLNVLSPAAVIIHLGVGFKNYIQIAGDSAEAQMIRKNLNEGLPSLMKRLATSMEIVEADLLDVSDDVKEESIQVGKLYVIVSNNKDAVLTRGSSYSLAPTFATLTTDAVLNAIRDGLNSLINDLALALNNEGIVSYSQWFANVKDIAKRASLLWVVATNLDDNEQFGRPEHQKIVQVCVEQREPVYDQIDLFRLDDPVIGKHTILSIYLPGTKSRLWCGVATEGFGPELSTRSPWKVFLERFSQIADSALLRLKVQRLQMEASETRNLATYAVTSQTVFHQIANMVRDVANPISSIKEALALGELQAKEEIVDLIKLSGQSADRLLEFAFMFMNVNKMDTHRPCSLLQAVNESKDLFEFNLKSNKIQLYVNIDRDFSIDVPYNVAFIAIANLLSNAKDAIGKRGGNIWIEAENVGDMIHCYVTNDGPFVDHKIRDRIFQIGATTKHGQNARGWGLYLVRRSLIENRGYIELSSSIPGETRFTIRFPNVRQE